MNKFLLLCTTLLVLSCATNTEVAGGSDLPNGIISGVVISSTGAPSNEAVVTLNEIELRKDGSSIRSEQVTKSDSTGYFEFRNLPESDFVLSVSSDGGEMAIESRVSTGEDDSTSLQIATDKSVTLVGRVVSDYNLPDSVSITGTDIVAAVTTTGMFTLNNVPVGTIDLSLFGSNLNTILPIEIAENTHGDTLYVRDIIPVTYGGELYEYHTSESAIYLSYPAVYGAKNTPVWYENIDFSGITYLSEQKSDSRSLWYIPVLVELDPAFVSKHGSLENAHAVVRSDFRKANSFYKNVDTKGVLYFSPDSVTSELSVDEVVPDGYSGRIVYSGDVQNSPINWNREFRKIVSSVDNLPTALALLRGTTLYSSYEIIPENNSVTGTAFIDSSLLMWGNGGDEIDPLTLYHFNRFTDVEKPAYSDTLTFSDFPQFMTFYVTNNGTAITNATVQIYGTERNSDSVNVSPRYSLITDANGECTLPELPYATGGGFTPFNNILVKITTAESSKFIWLPDYIVQGEFFSSGNSTYTYQFEMN